MPHKVAVVIVNYNGGEMLERCLTALDRQTHRPDRVLLVDNHSDAFREDRMVNLYPGIEIQKR